MFCWLLLSILVVSSWIRDEVEISCNHHHHWNGVSVIEPCTRFPNLTASSAASEVSLSVFRRGLRWSYNPTMPWIYPRQCRNMRLTVFFSVHASLKMVWVGTSESLSELFWAPQPLLVELVVVSCLHLLPRMELMMFFLGDSTDLRTAYITVK